MAKYKGCTISTQIKNDITLRLVKGQNRGPPFAAAPGFSQKKRPSEDKQFSPEGQKHETSNDLIPADVCVPKVRDTCCRDLPAAPTRPPPRLASGDTGAGVGRHGGRRHETQRQALHSSRRRPSPEQDASLFTLHASRDTKHNASKNVPDTFNCPACW
jgi:hypothetical protein